MSIDTARNEFYHVPASWLKEATDLECAQHALKKWTMFLPENLKKHDIEFYDGAIVPRGGNKLYEGMSMVGINTCALCQKHNEDGDGDCYQCPFYRFNGNVKCYGVNRSGVDYYDQGKSNPEIMVEALQELVENLQVEEDV